MPSTGGSARPSGPMPPRYSGDEERDEWLSANYCRPQDPFCTPDHPKRLRHAPEPAPLAYGRYRALRDEVPPEDMEPDFEGSDRVPMEDFRITPPRESVSRSGRDREEEEYVEDVPRGFLGGAYVEEPQRNRVDIAEELDVAAMGTHGGSWWEPWSTSQPEFMVSKAAAPLCGKT